MPEPATRHGFASFSAKRRFLEEHHRRSAAIRELASDFYHPVRESADLLSAAPNRATAGKKESAHDPLRQYLHRLIGVKLTATYPAFSLVYSVASGILVGWIL